MKFHPVLILLAAAFIGFGPLGFSLARAEDPAPAEAPATETAPAKEASSAVLDTDTAKISYIIGMRMGEGFKKSKLELDVKAFVAAIEDVIHDRQPAMNEEEMMATEKLFQEKMAAEQKAETTNNLEAAKAFLEENGKKPGVVTTDSGLQYTEVKPGEGDKRKRHPRCAYIIKAACWMERNLTVHTSAVNQSNFRLTRLFPVGKRRFC